MFHSNSEMSVNFVKQRIMLRILLSWLAWRWVIFRHAACYVFGVSFGMQLASGIDRLTTTRVSETRVFPSLDRVSGTLCLSHYVTEIPAAANSDCCFFAPCTNILTYLLNTATQFVKCSKLHAW